MENPLFGVGPGNFPAYAARQAMDQGVKAGWQGTHNSYLQVSSEAGIPGLIFMICMIWAAGRRMFLVYREAASYPHLRDVQMMALCLLVAIVGLAVNLTFSHIAHRFYIPSLIGLAVALHQTALPLLAQAEQTKSSSPSLASMMRLAGR